MKRNHLFTVAAFVVCCFGGWACSSSHENQAPTYFFTDTGTGTDTQTTPPLPGTGGSVGGGGSAAVGGSPGMGGIISTGGIAGMGSASTSVQPDAAIDAGTLALNCGGEYQLPCAGACNPGVREQYIGVLAGNNATAVLACVPCPKTSNQSFITGPVECANFGILYNIALCSYFYNGMGVAAPEQCDGQDNDCSGQIDDGIDPCLAAKGSSWKCTQAIFKALIIVTTTTHDITVSYPINSCQDTCVHSCAGKSCGDDDGCGTRCSGTCPFPGQACSMTGLCYCATPDCAGKVCGADDGCGATCMGTCPSGKKCLGDPLTSPDAGFVYDAANGSGYISFPSSPVYTCKTNPCDGKACGDASGYGYKCMGSCPTGEFCDADHCVCAPNCTNQACGAADGCGSTCSGTCPTGRHCASSSSGPYCAYDSATQTSTSINTGTGTGTGTGVSTCGHDENGCLNFTLGYDSGTGWLIGNATNNCSQQIWCMFYPNDGSNRQGLTLSPGVTYGEVSGGLYWPNASNVQFSCILPTDPISCFPPG
jgi:hypothetical protein